MIILNKQLRNFKNTICDLQKTYRFLDPKTAILKRIKNKAHEYERYRRAL
jgi:hypothetical protein